MAKSRFEYVKDFENREVLLSDTFICVEIQVHKFKDFCLEHSFLEPFDDELIALFENVIKDIMMQFEEIGIVYAHENDFWFIFQRSAHLFNRRREKMLSTLVSTFASLFVMKWKNVFATELSELPELTGNVFLIPRLSMVRMLLNALQLRANAICIRKCAAHALTRSGVVDGEKVAFERTFAEQNEILFKCGINYNSLPALHKRGIIYLLPKRKGKIVGITDIKFWDKVKPVLKP